MPNIVPFYRTAGAWGPGMGRNIHDYEFDQDLWALDQAVQNLISNPPAAVSITSFTVVGSLLYVNMSNSTVLGPYQLPVANWNFRGAWQTSTVYAALDVITNANSVYLVLFNHTSASTTFDPAANDGLGHNYYGLLLTITGATIPNGGATGYALRKNSPTDDDYSWQPVHEIPTGGAAGAVLLKNSGADYDTTWAIRINTLAQLIDTNIPGTQADQALLQWDIASMKWLPQPRYPVPTNDTSSAYQLQPGDDLVFRRFNSGSGCTITVPSNATVPFDVGTEINFRVNTTGTVTVAWASPVTVSVPAQFVGSAGSPARMLGNGSAGVLKKVDTDSWDLSGLLYPM